MNKFGTGAKIDADYQAQKRPFLLLILLVMLALAAGAFLAYCTDYAPWGFSDSAAYFSAARNLAAGHSLSVTTADGGLTPLNLHAPLYSLVLAIFAKFGANLIHVSKIMDIGFWTLFIFLCGWLFFKITGRQVEAFCFALACAFSTPLVTSYSSLMSEPLALVLGIPGFLLLALAVREGSRRLLILSAVCIGLSVMTRFAFAAVLAAGALVILVFSAQHWRKRWVELFIFGAIGFAPMGVWMLVQKLQHVSTGGRSLIFTDLLSKIRNFAAAVWNTLKYWLPYRTNMIPGVRAKYFTPLLAMGFILLVVVGIYIAVRTQKKDVMKDSAFLVAGSSVLFILSYLAVLVAGYAFTSPSHDINDRILSPLYPAIIALLLSSALLAGTLVKGKALAHILAVVVTLFFVVFNFELLRTYGLHSSKYPNGYTSPYWNSSRIFEVIQKLPPGTAMASNAPDITLFYTNYLPYCLTENPTKRGDCLSAADQSKLQDFVERKCGVLILFPSSPTENYENYADPISQASMDGLAKLYPALFRAPPGVILYSPECTGLRESLAGE